jgi:hypothetical protein
MKYRLPIFVAIAAIALAPHNAQASSYSNPSGTTLIHIYGENEQSPYPRPFPEGDGHYRMTIGSVNWYGEFTLPTVSTIGGTKSYIGTFRGSRPNPASSAGVNLTCTGTVKIDRTLFAGKYKLKVKWTITGGTGCSSSSSIHPTFRSLKEALPIANFMGNFTSTNSTTFVGIQESGTRIWPKWKVVKSTGIPCLSTPGGTLVQHLPLSTIGSSPQTFDSTNQWLQVSVNNGNTCYVRANSAYIKPVQIPF